MEFKQGKIYWQAHRGGGGKEAPDNTLYAMNYGWSLGGIPEADIRVTADNEIVCLHDNTLARTTDAPAELASLPVRSLTLEQVQRYDAGRKFDERCAGQHVPALREVFAIMSASPEKMLYCDIKNYDSEAFPFLLKGFKTLAEEYGVVSQLIVAGCDYALNCRFKEEMPGIHTLHWLGAWGEGNHAAKKLEQFRELADVGFKHIDIVQFHLEFIAEPADGWHYDLTQQELRDAFAAIGESLEVFPFDFTKNSIEQLLKLGITQYATDEPSRFSTYLHELGY